MGWVGSHLVAEDQFARLTLLLSGRSIAPLVLAIFWRLSNVLPEGWLECRLRVLEFLTYSPKPLALVVGERVHRIQNHRPHSWFLQFSRKMLAIQLEQKGIEKALRLAAGGAGGNDDVTLIQMDSSNRALLMNI